MNSILRTNYHVDKLILIYQTPNDFLPTIENDDQFLHYILGNHNVFIFTKKVYSSHYVVPRYTLEYMLSESETIKLGEFKPDIEQAITIEIDNQFLYSNRWNLLYEFEQTYNLKLDKIAQIDVACDSNHNLPRKLNEILHKPNCSISRRGSKLPLTDKGNQILGTRISQNIKTIACPERPNQSYYFELRTSGSRRPILYRAYDKGKEITEKSHKEYIRESDGFEDAIYRLEVSITSYELKKQAKNKTGVSIEYIYRNLANSEFLKDFFIKHFDRLGALTIEGKRYKISEYLRLN